ncbi:PREDICTED: solute carrier family 13 member 5-like isoform X2 [Priapulus caudatus]|uniref:Solute carrier family 13 member 5-like isoform X2 n=1 Tax=Priapulus caudatus TaxID=37621 RepID=A0ABM1DR88_PRICU|nr:PREDICTED: solute carrier family 13 member 5-like isoform X2 [Priapulus caudatus]
MPGRVSLDLEESPWADSRVNTTFTSSSDHRRWNYVVSIENPVYEEQQQQQDGPPSLPHQPSVEFQQTTTEHHVEELEAEFGGEEEDANLEDIEHVAEVRKRRNVKGNEQEDGQEMTEFNHVACQHSDSSSYSGSLEEMDAMIKPEAPLAPVENGSVAMDVEDSQPRSRANTRTSYRKRLPSMKSIMTLDFASIEKDEEDRILTKGMLLSIAYGAATGGTATLTGTPPNLVLSGLLETYYGSDAGVNFATWFVYSAPGALVMLLITWLWLQFVFLGWRTLFGCCIKGRNTSDATVERVIRDQYRRLGPMSFAEVEVMVCFFFVVFLWFTRDPKFTSGWSKLFDYGTGTMVSDATAALIVAFLLFTLPVEPPKLLWFMWKPTNPDSQEALIDWKTVQHKMPWGVVFLLGGGFALAKGVEESGLSQYISVGLSSMISSLPVAVAVLICCIMTGCLTEVVSNTATANIVLSLLPDLAASLKISPLLLMFPSTIVASFAFSLPVATPPNAIIYATGELSVLDMVRTGVLLDVCGILLATFMANTYGVKFFGFGEIPAWTYGGAGIIPAFNATS